MKIRYILVVCILSTFVSGCASLGRQVADVVFIAHPKSAKTLGENTRLTLLFEEDLLQPEIANQVAAFNGPGNIIAGIISKGLEEDAKRYSANHGAEVTSDRFYSKLAGERKHKDLVGFLYTREIKKRNSECVGSYAGDLDGDPIQNCALAMSFCAAILPSSRDVIFGDVNPDKSVKPYYRVEQTSLHLYYAKAKVIGFDMTSPFGVDLLNPWEILTKPFNGALKGYPMSKQIKMVVNTSVDGHWIAPNGTPTTASLGERSFVDKAVTFSNPKAKSAGMNEAPAVTDTSSDRNRIRTSCLKEIDSLSDVHDNDFSKLFAAPPSIDLSQERCFVGDECKSLITLKVKVFEEDGYADRVGAVKSAFDEAIK